MGRRARRPAAGAPILRAPGHAVPATAAPRRPERSPYGANLVMRWGDRQLSVPVQAAP